MWSSLIGHASQQEQLKRAIASGRLPNAWLFAGPRGVGKRRTADILAAALVCASAPTHGGDPCGACAACRKVAAQSHPDVFVVEPESEQKPSVRVPSHESRVPSHEAGVKSAKKKPSEVIRIEQVRGLQAGLQFHPLEAPVKLAIVDEADRMSESTANSLLKILEEPPPATHFVLISTLPHALLPTIRSRASRMDFGPLSDDEIAEVLTRDGKATRAEGQRIARLSGGSLGSALACDPEFVGRTMGRFLALVRKGNSADIIETADEWSHASPHELRLIFTLLVSFYRDILRLSATGDEKRLIHPEAVQTLPVLPHGRAERGLAEIEAASRSLESTANKQLMFEHLLFSLTR